MENVFKQGRQDFVDNFDNLFDIAHADALQLIKINDNRNILQRQREPGRPGHLAGVDKKLTDREERARLRTIEEEKRRAKYLSEPTPSTSSYVPLQNGSSSESNENLDLLEDVSKLVENTQLSITPLRRDFNTPKLVAGLDRCQLSIGDSVFIREATIETFGYNNDEFPISKSSFQRIRTVKRKECAETIKIDFQNVVPEVVTVHWDGKLLPALNARKSKEERLPIVISYKNQKQLIAVPRLESSTGSEQAQAVRKTIVDWNLADKVQIFCCDTTTLNTGRINGACVLLEQKLNGEMLIFACRHRVYELVLKGVFEAKINQVTTSPDIPLFNKFRKNWKSINADKIQNYREKLTQHLTDSEIDNLLEFYRTELTK
ncbi:hypothetical protein EVAR_78606_1 [Eumeta japonica]|uniref:Uncharacterized protein n=1 Tax=Eumeta variegata TaxID=151549 RepID=A0A4C1U8J8_EUMVA|nr:hypothetical protein EVAR_78606_1 [Eumeta japonica]